MLKTILIDDETHCLQSLEFLLKNHFADIEILDRCSDGEAALESLQKHRPDFIFMDIEMPLLNGFQVLERLGELSFSVIFTTAYSRYAVRAFRFCALDFLLKPIDPTELIEAVNRVKASASQKNHSPEQLDLLKKSHQKEAADALPVIALPSLEGLNFVNVREILYCESDGNYSKIHLETERNLLVSRPLKELEMLLEGRAFYRIHKQFLINLRHIRSYHRGDGGEVEIKNERLPVARNRKEGFLKIFLKS